MRVFGPLRISFETSYSVFVADLANTLHIPANNIDLSLVTWKPHKKTAAVVMPLGDENGFLACMSQIQQATCSSPAQIISINVSKLKLVCFLLYSYSFN